MFGKTFELNDRTMSFVEEIGNHMPGGFFIYRKEEPEELLYVNKACLDIFGCSDEEEFKELTGYTFRGMVFPEDYPSSSATPSRSFITSSFSIGRCRRWTDWILEELIWKADQAKSREN